MTFPRLAACLLSFCALLAVANAPFTTAKVEKRYLYVAEPGIRNYVEYGGIGLLVYDMDAGYKLVKRIPTWSYAAGQAPENVKGVVANAQTGKIYLSTPQRVACWDLVSEKKIWDKEFGGGADRMALAPDGKTMYVPSFEGPHWLVVNALDGTIIKKLVLNAGAHNTIYSLDGKHAYLAGLKSPLLRVTDTRTHEVTQEIGPFTKAIRPFTINGAQSLVYVNVNELLGFEIGDLKTGKMLHRVEAQGVSQGPVKRHGCPSHGIGLTPDEKEVWIADGHNEMLHVFDNTVMPPRQIKSLKVREQPGWITFSLDGKHAWPSTGEVIDVKTKATVTLLTDEEKRMVMSEKVVELHFVNGKPVRAGAPKRGDPMRQLFSCLALLGCLLLPVTAQSPKPLPPLRAQADLQQQWLKLRLERVLPALMRKHGIELWLVICREYNEDPVYRALTSPTVFAARRRTILVFHDRGHDRGPDKGVERLALGGGSNGGLYQVYRDPEVENRELYGEGQWAVLRKLIAERDPKTIGVNISATHAFSDGLSAGEWEKLQATLGETYKQRIKRAEELPLEYIATRLPEMLPVYRQMQEHVHALLTRAFSSEVITPGKTTNQDVVWWLRQQTHDAGFGTWFQTTVRVQRRGAGIPSNLAEDAPVVIERGDVLHCDYGLVGMGLATDTQHMAYVLKAGEKDAPKGIQQALANTNRMQDILLAEMRPGRSGNEVLAAAIAAMKAASINGTFYTHPIGDHGHGAGPLIGLWDRQEGVPGRGDVKLIPNMWHSIELGARTPVPEWGGQELFVGQEEDAVMDGAGKMSWVLRRQTKYHLIK